MGDHPPLSETKRRLYSLHYHLETEKIIHAKQIMINFVNKALLNEQEPSHSKVRRLGVYNTIDTMHRCRVGLHQNNGINGTKFPSVPLFLKIGSGETKPEWVSNFISYKQLLLLVLQHLLSMNYRISILYLSRREYQKVF